jgi:hypothetical protein
MGSSNEISVPAVTDLSLVFSFWIRNDLSGCPNLATSSRLPKNVMNSRRFKVGFLQQATLTTSSN